jgi:hypothetical protein
MKSFHGVTELAWAFTQDLDDMIASNPLLLTSAYDGHLEMASWFVLNYR